MNIIYLTTEAVPLAKTGGLADVCGTLPIEVASRGHQTALIMPAFRSVYESGLSIEPTDISFAVSLSGQRLMGCRVLQTRLPNSEVPVWLIDQPQYFDRAGLYGDANGDYPDNAERFIFFCRAAMITIERMGWSVDMVHCNDWQTGLVPALMKAESKRWSWIRKAPTPSKQPLALGNLAADDADPGTRSVMTIHNLAYQGVFPKASFPMIGLDWKHFNQDEFEYYDQLNFLKTGLVTADAITTVSPKYAEEIRTLQYGCGLDAILRGASDRVTGIINGIDQVEWDPSNDPLLTHCFDVNSWQDGKPRNKIALQKRFSLDQSESVPLIGLVGRLASQKGWDLILPVLRQHLIEQRPTQWVVLGSGDPSIEWQLNELASRYAGQLGLHIGFSNELAHQIEASSDLFVMPSHYEPCGLNQLYSLRYGTVPIVTATGGLADTVVDCSPESIKNGTASGFHLRDHSARSLDLAIGQALNIRYHETQQWKQIVETGMRQDWSWAVSAKKYVDVYAKTVALKPRLT